MKKAFSLVELMIVVAILGILAAIVLPEFQSNSQKAKESTAKANLQTLRETIERFALDHNGHLPGYSNGNYIVGPNNQLIYRHLVEEKYLLEVPENPFNGKTTFRIVPQGQAIVATGAYGWLYQPTLKKIQLDWPGTDSQSIPYSNY